MCCIFQKLFEFLAQTFSVDGIRGITGHSYPERATNFWKASWPYTPNCCFQIMRATPMPSRVAKVELKDLKPFICLVSFLKSLWSCSMMLFKYLNWRISVNQYPPLKICRQFMFCSLARLTPLLSITALSGKLLFPIVQMKNAVAAASSLFF